MVITAHSFLKVPSMPKREWMRFINFTLTFLFPPSVDLKCPNTWSGEKSKGRGVGFLQ